MIPAKKIQLCMTVHDKNAWLINWLRLIGQGFPQKGQN